MTTLHKNSGFTLIEIIVVVGILSFILSFGMFMNLSYFNSDIFLAEEATIVSALEKARSRSMNNIYETVHGVCFISPNYVIFRGRDTCLPADGTEETIPANENIANISDYASTFPTIIFSQLSGTTTPTTITFTDGVKSRSISTNAEGAIVW